MRRGGSVFAALRNVENSPNGTQIFGSSAPVMTHFRQSNAYGLLRSVGVRGTF